MWAKGVRTLPDGLKTDCVKKAGGYNKPDNQREKIM